MSFYIEKKLKLAKEMINTQNPFRLLGVTNEEIKEIRREIHSLVNDFYKRFLKSQMNSSKEIEKLAVDLVELSVFLSLIFNERIHQNHSDQKDKDDEADKFTPWDLIEK